jgi:hypothetical protein
VGKLKATAKAAEKAVDKVAELIRLGYPESTAKKIASGELPMDQASRMARADEMFPASGYHGTDSDISAFDLNRGGHATGANSAKQGVWIANDSRVADSYANHAAIDAKISRIVDQAHQAEKRGDYDEYERLIIEAEDKEQAWQYGGADARNLGQNTMPLRMRGNFFEYDAGGEAYFALEDEVNDVIENARKQGYDGVTFKNLDDSAGWSDMPADHTVVFDPSNIRSTNAAFDPDQKDSSNLLAGLGAAGVGLGLMQSEDADAVPIVKAGRRMIEAYHGSPHKFDKFSMENIGTGEGAQAYGHGLYFADSEDVARNYRNDLTQRGLLGGKDVIQPDGVSDAEAAIVQGALSKFEGFWESPKDIVREMRRNAAELEDTADYYNTQRQWMDDPLKQHMVTDAHRQNLIDLEEQMGQQRSDMEALQIIERSGGIDAFKPQGALYRVHLDVDPDTLLDWDKPLREQSEAIQEAVKSSLVSRKLDEMGDDEFYSVMQNIDPNGAWSPEDQMDELGEVLSKDDLIANLREYSPDMLAEVEDYLSADFDPAMSGASLYRQATAQRGGGSVMSNKAQAEVSRKLHEAGIPGIRYADGMSRGKDGGTYNYVMFDDKPISIQERGNVDPTLLAATGGASAIGLAASQFLQNRQQKQSQWESLRSDLLNTVTSVDRAIGKGFEALEMPWRGLLGLNRTVAGLLYGEGAQAVQEGARVAQQPVEQTAYDMGGVATDASGSPVVGAAVNTMVNLGGPI